MSALEEAVRLAARGFAVMPVDPASKRPVTPHGSRDASTDPARVRALFDARPGAGLAIATGTASSTPNGRGLVVVDVDPRSGGLEGLEAAERNLGPLPATARASTPSCGWHLYLRAPGAVIVRNSAGAIAPGVDVRGEGGYVVAPPGAGREWTHKLVPAELPAGWVGAARAGAGEQTTRVSGDEWAALLTAIPSGARNDSLARIAGHLLAKDVNARMVLALVRLINRGVCQPPLPPEEVERVVDSIARAELRKRTGRAAR